MTEDRLTSSDKRTLLLWILLGIAGAVFAQRYFFRAFPEASVDFRVSKSEALERARKFVSSLGEDVSGYQTAIVFDLDDNAKTYLEREVGLQQANRLMSSELNIWYWDARFFRPQQEEEFHVRVSPGGEIVGYEHKIKEAQAGATLDETAAEKTAQDFLSGKLGVDLSKWDFLSEEANSSKKPNRTDWSFTWEKHGFKAKDAPYRLSVTLQGDRAGGEEEFLHVPEAWERSYEHLRSINILYNQAAIIPYFLLMIAALWHGISLTKKGQTGWGGAIKLGVVVAILLTFMQLNQWPLDRMGYDTNGEYGNYVLGEIAKALAFGILSALTVVLPIPGGEALYRTAQPERLMLTKAFTLRGMRTREFFRSAAIGLTMAAAHIGFIVAFYIVAGHFGAWAPQDLNYENSVNTTFPWIAGVAIGMLAATSEEFLFRLFAIPLLHRLTGSRVLAVIVPAFCWSFLHSAYPNEPPYIRGLEVGLIGIVAGVVMLRWGILATLIWHYTVDASLVGLLLVRSNSLYFKVSGVLVGLAALAPLLLAGISYLARGRFEPEEDLLNGAHPLPEPRVETQEGVAEATSGARYQALTPGMMMFLAVCLVLGGAAVWRLKTPSVGSYLKLSVDARSAKARADEVLRGRGLDASSYHGVTSLVNTTDAVTNEFLRRRIGVAALNEIYAGPVPGALWSVRYFKDGQAEEYRVVLKPDGSLHSVHHTLAEDAAGAWLAKEEAIARAEKFLREEKKIDLAAWTLVDAGSEKRPHRIDHTLTWQQNAALDGGGAGSPASADDHAHARIDLDILGDEPADYRTYIKIPDEWRRQQEEQTVGRALLSYLPLVLLGGVGIAAVVVFFLNLRSEAMRQVPWRAAAGLAVWGMVAYAVIIVFGDRLQMFLNAYSTAIPLRAFLGGIGIALLVGLFFYGAAFAALFGVASYFGNRAFGAEALPIGRALPGSYYRDAVWIGVCGAAGLAGLHSLIEAGAGLWPTLHRSWPAAFGQGFDDVLPAGGVFGGALLSGLLAAGTVALVATFLAAVLRARWMRLAIFALGALALTPGNWGNPTDLAKQALANAILLAIIVLAVLRITRFNVLGCLLVAACMVLGESAVQLIGQPDPFYRANGYAAAVLMLVVLGWPLARWRMRESAG